MTVNKNDRHSIATSIERLINMLDELEPDPDLEPWLGTGDDLEVDVSDYEPDADAESTATERPGMGFVASATDDSEDGGDTEPNGDEIDYVGGEVDAAIPIWGGNEDNRDRGLGLQRAIT